MLDENHESPDLSIWRAVGHGAFVGLWASPLCHWLWGANMLILPFAYGFGMSSLRSWPELAAILSMLGTTVAYFGVYDVVAADGLGLWSTVALIALVVVLFFVFQGVVANQVDAARVKALVTSSSQVEHVERSQQWEERYYQRLRGTEGADKGAGRWFLWWTVRLLLAIGLGALALLYWDSRAIPTLALGVALYHLIVFQRASRYHRRLVQEGAEMVVGRSTRRPVLFLRPFALDALPVAPMEVRWSLLKVMSWFDKRTFEELLVEAFEDLGPVIAIGRPGEEVSMLGAAREYAPDESWRDLVLNRARAAQLVIMEVDASPGMQWELDHVPELVGLQRTLVMLPPGEDVLEPRSPAWYARWIELQGRYPFLPDVSEETAAIVFDDDGLPVVVRNKSSIAATLNDVKATWLRQRSLSEDFSSWVVNEGVPSAEPTESTVEASTASRTTPGGSEASNREQRRQLEKSAAALGGLAARRSVLHGRDDPERMRLLHERAKVYLALGDLRSAQRLLEDVITRQSKAEGCDGRLTLSALGDLASTQRLKGDLTGCRATTERIAQGSAQVFGDDHAATFAARTQMGLAMQELGEFGAARALLERLLEGAAADPADRRRAQRLLGSVLTSTGEFEAARALLDDALEETRDVLGDASPEVYETTAMLAEVHSRLRHRDLAAELGRDALAGAEQSFGPSHPLTLKYLLNAARFSADAGEVDRSRALAERAVETTRSTLGADHPDTLTALSVLGRARRASGEYEPAIDLFLLAWKGRRRVLGDRHPHTLAALTSAAGMQYLAGQEALALRNLDKAARGYLETLGPDHSDTRGVQEQLRLWQEKAEGSS